MADNIYKSKYTGIEIDTILAGAKNLKVPEVINTLESTATDKPLSANMGRELKESIPTEETLGVDSLKRLENYGLATQVISDEALFSFELNSDGTGYLVNGNWDVEDTTITEIVIPYEYKGLPVTEIGNRAFYEYSHLTNVTIPISITFINSYAFQRSGLINITIPSSVNSIGDGICHQCDHLKDINFKGSIENFTGFSACSELTYAEVPDGVITIKGGAFQSSSSVTTVKIPVSVTKIESLAFYGCKNISNVYYEGTEEEWNSIAIEINNEHLKNATIHYNWTPTTEGYVNEKIAEVNKGITDAEQKSEQANTTATQAYELANGLIAGIQTADNARKAECDLEGNNISETYATKFDLEGAINGVVDGNNPPSIANKADCDVLGNLIHEHYATKEELSAIPKFNILPVTELPSQDISPTTVYLIPYGDESQNIYDEYIYVNGKWEKLGTQKMDLSGYATKDDLQSVDDTVTQILRGGLCVRNAEKDSEGNVIYTTYATKEEVNELIEEIASPLRLTNSYSEEINAGAHKLWKDGDTIVEILAEKSDGTIVPWEDSGYGRIELLAIDENGNPTGADYIEALPYTIKAPCLSMFINPYKADINKLIFKFSRNEILNASKLQEQVNNTSESLGDIETALDNIIAIQNALIGGGSV